MIDTNVTCIPHHITTLAFSANTAQECTPTMFRVNPGHGTPNPLVRVESLVRLGVRVITRLGRNLVGEESSDGEDDTPQSANEGPSLYPDYRSQQWYEIKACEMKDFHESSSSSDIYCDSGDDTDFRKGD